MQVGEAAPEAAVGGQLRETLRADLAEHPARVVPARLPELRIDGLEEVERLGVPRPPQVGDELTERREFLRIGGAHREAAESFHVRRR